MLVMATHCKKSGKLSFKADNGEFQGVFGNFFSVVWIREVKSAFDLKSIVWLSDVYNK